MSDNEVSRILAAEALRCRLIGEGEFGQLADLLAEELVHVHATGTVHDKAAYLEHVQAHPRVPVRRDLRVTVLNDDAAVVVGDLYNTADGQIAEGSTPLVAVQLWVRRGGEWKQATFQATRKS